MGVPMGHRTAAVMIPGPRERQRSIPPQGRPTRPRRTPPRPATGRPAASPGPRRTSGPPPRHRCPVAAGTAPTGDGAVGLGASHHPHRPRGCTRRTPTTVRPTSATTTVRRGLSDWNRLPRVTPSPSVSGLSGRKCLTDSAPGLRGQEPDRHPPPVCGGESRPARPPRPSRQPLGHRETLCAIPTRRATKARQPEARCAAHVQASRPSRRLPQPATVEPPCNLKPDGPIHYTPTS